MKIHASDFGSIALVISIVGSFLFFLFVQKALKRLIVDQKYSASTFFLVHVFFFGFFIFIPIAICAGTGYALHWLHNLLRGPFTYGSTGYEVAYDFFTQLVFLGIAESIFGVYLSYRSLKQQRSKKSNP